MKDVNVEGHVVYGNIRDIECFEWYLEVGRARACCLDGVIFIDEICTGSGLAELMAAVYESENISGARSISSPETLDMWEEIKTLAKDAKIITDLPLSADPSEKKVIRHFSIFRNDREAWSPKKLRKGKNHAKGKRK